MSKNLTGKKMPKFKDYATSDKEISNADFENKNLVIYFYPKDSTPGCTTEGQDFRDNYKKFQKLNTEILKSSCIETLKINAMVFFIIIGASLFSLVFRGFGGDLIVENFLTDIPGAKINSLIIVMITIFILGFFLDFFQIVFVIVPIVGPSLISMGYDPIWLALMFAINLQTSFLTPPFGFALFYLRGVAPKEIKTIDIYYGVIPFIFIQIVLLVILYNFPEIITWLPKKL